MPPSQLAQRRTHNTLLFQKLLNLRDGVSPFTLVLDSLEESGWGVVNEILTRAKTAKSKVLLLSFETIRRPVGVDVLIRGRGRSLTALREEIVGHMSPSPNPASGTKILLMIDTLQPLASLYPTQLPLFLSSLLAPQTSVVAVYHTDVPLPHHDDYSPHPLTTLSYLATAILRVESLGFVVERKRARDRSQQEPGWGIGEGREGVLFGLRAKTEDGKVRGVVVEMELRRKSGRGVRETFVLTKAAGTSANKICLLDDHPLYAPPEIQDRSEESGEVETTFNLGLTEKQRRDREGVVLPYFDAQEGGGEGGRILYEMEDVDDFDEEEDEI